MLDIRLDSCDEESWGSISLDRIGHDESVETWTHILDVYLAGGERSLDHGHCVSVVDRMIHSREPDNIVLLLLQVGRYVVPSFERGTDRCL